MKRVLTGIFFMALLASIALLAQTGQARVQCDPGNGGLTLPSGFCALVVADNVGSARHLVVSRSGDIYVATRNQESAPGGVVALRDTNGDGRGDVRERFGDSGGTGIQIYNNYLYMSCDDAVVRFPLKEGQLSPAGPMEVVVVALFRDSDGKFRERDSVHGYNVAPCLPRPNSPERIG